MFKQNNHNISRLLSLPFFGISLAMFLIGIDEGFDRLWINILMIALAVVGFILWSKSFIVRWLLNLGLLALVGLGVFQIKRVLEYDAMIRAEYNPLVPSRYPDYELDFPMLSLQIFGVSFLIVSTFLFINNTAIIKQFNTNKDEQS